MLSLLSFNSQSLNGPKQATLNIGKLRNIVKEQKYDGLPFVLVSLRGEKRAGCSLLTALLMSKLQYEAKRQSGTWLESDAPIDGTQWKRSRESITKGILISEQPVIISTGEKEQVAVMFMDCESLNVQTPAPNQEVVDVIVSLCSTMLANIQIHNSRTDMKCSQVKACMKHICKQDGLAVMSKKLVIAHKDWESDDNLGSRELKDKGAYGGLAMECQSYMLPTPGEMIRKGDVSNESTLNEWMADPECEEFLKYVDQLGELFKGLATSSEYQSTRNELLKAIQDTENHIQEKIASMVDDYQKIVNAALFEQLNEVQSKSYRVSQKAMLELDISQAEAIVMGEISKKKSEIAMTEVQEVMWREVTRKVQKEFEQLKENKLKQLTPDLLEQRNIFIALVLAIGVVLLYYFIARPESIWLVSSGEVTRKVQELFEQLKDEKFKALASVFLKQSTFFVVPVVILAISVFYIAYSQARSGLHDRRLH